MTTTAPIKLSGFWPSHMDKTEARICNKLITKALSEGFHIRVREGEDGEVMCEPTRQRSEIQAQTHATCMTLYDILKEDGMGFDRIGTVLLVHGNGEDVISDMAWPQSQPENEAVLEALADHAVT